jgi:uncharacterized membrane protein YcaP (DUF421 family)
MNAVFYTGWEPLLRTLILGVLAYFTLLLLMRVTGKRTLTKMNAFDLVLTVALGSTLAAILTSKDVPLAQGAVAFGLVVGLQYVITWASVRCKGVYRLVTGEPRLIVHKGEFLDHALKTERLTREEVLATVRSQGLSGLEKVEAMILETNGSISLIERPSASSEALEPVVTKG